jgi:dTMP kinase
MSRVKERVISDRFEQEQVSFFERVRQAYLLQAQKNPNRIQIINANQSLPAVQSDMVAHLLSLLKK